MSRSTIGVAQHKKRKAAVKKAKGFVGGRSKLRRIAQGAVVRAEVHATHDRRKRKGDFRRLWITRISAAVRALGTTYSRFIEGLAKSGIELDRKTLSELAIQEPEAFRAVVERARSALAK
ncbi:MAG: 50S ribosomal protein L20 [Planctomycetota bacterium]|jgi:large subunit ribosomal protein L20|nr:50S ribosomal protein L20 [Planctomycetota bacterium]